MCISGMFRYCFHFIDCGKKAHFRRVMLFVCLAVLQMLAAAEARRDLIYFTFGDADLLRDVHNIHTLITHKHITVGKTHFLFPMCVHIFNIFELHH